MLRVLLISALLLISGKALSNSPDQLNASMQAYLDSTFEGKNMKAIGYGGGDKFRPKTFWIYLDNLAKASKGSEKKARPAQGWIVLSNGKAIHSDELVPVTVEQIDLPIAGMTQERKLGFAAALTGAFKFLTGDTKLSFDDGKNITINIEIEEAVEERIELIDVLLSQTTNKFTADDLNAVVTNTFGKGRPIRMINSAIKVRGVKLVATVTSNADINLDVGIAKYLTKLGFKYNKDKNTFETLQFDDWRYLAYSSIYTRDVFNISTDETKAEAEMGIDNIVTDINTTEYLALKNIKN